MKVLVATAYVGGWNYTQPFEPLKFPALVCGRYTTCGCDRSFVGTTTNKSASHAEVIEVPECFELPADVEADPFLQRALELVADYPVGTIVSPRFTGHRWSLEPDDWTCEVVEASTLN